MISWTRSETPSVLNLDDSGSRATRELGRAVEYFEEPRTSDVEPKFESYRDPSVRDALKDAFKRKCVYCEGPGASFDCDIEHFRPKGRVAEESEGATPHPGYWWLAMDWINLTLSCQHCNQRRSQIVLEPGMTEKQAQDAIERNQRVTVGKLDSFPVREGTRAFTKADINQEVPLLINPVDVDPSEHIEWDFSHDLPMPVPKDGSDMGEASIIGYALWRSHLAEDRKALFLDLKMIRNDIAECVSGLAAAVDELETQRFKTRMEAKFEDLYMYCRSHRPYAGMARSYYFLVLSEFG